MLAASICLGLPASAFAETASQITPPSFRPPPQTNMAAVTIPEGSGLEAPAGAEKLKVKLRDVSVEGGLPDMAEATRKIVSGLAHRTVTAAEIFAAARALETEYGRAGYALVRVVLPAQKLNDGARLRLVVIDGYLERIDTSNLPERIRGRVEATLASLVGQKSIKLSAIERKLLLAGDTPGARLRSTLQAGAVKGFENRTAPIRAITTPNDGACRLEHRAPGADINPYLSIAAILAAGCEGIEKDLPLEAPVTSNLANLDKPKLPRTLNASIEAFAGSDFCAEAFGEAFRDNYAESRRAEQAAFDAWQASHITDFEWQRYFVS